MTPVPHTRRAGRLYIRPPRPDFDMMYFKHTGINPFVLTRADASALNLQLQPLDYFIGRHDQRLTSLPSCFFSRLRSRTMIEIIKASINA